MRYLLLVFEDPAETPVPADDRAFTAQLVQAGTFRAALPLAAATTATTVRLRGGRRHVSDGPFVDTREQLVACWLVDARDLDEALAIAERVPAARFGAVEVRPVLREP